MPTLRIQLLGNFKLAYDDTPMTAVNSPRLQSLLAYLVLHRDAPQARHHLAFLLWPDSSESQARTNLRYLLHQLRRALPKPDQFLQLEGPTLQWRADAPFTLDVADYESALAQADQGEKAAALAQVRLGLERAVALYRGDLLPSCYDDWVLPERERLRQLFIGALERLIALLENQREYPSAIKHAETLLRHDPLNEAAYRDLMRLYALSGDRAGALRVYHTCATTLQRELAVEPSVSTREAYERLLEMNVPTASLEATPPTLVAEMPLVGRTQEWARLQTVWRTASVGRAHLVLLSGEVGIGKTRLAEGLLQWADRQGIFTASARCYAAQSVLTFMPVVTWLRARPLPALEQVWLTEVARLLPEILVDHPGWLAPDPVAEPWQRQRLFEALVRALLSSQPLLLLLDDLQWCDRDTLEWLDYLLHHEPRARLLIVGTLRPEEVNVEPPLDTLLTALRNSGQLTEIELKPLTEAESVSLAASVAGQPLAPDRASALYRETEGNPLFVVETVRAELSKEAGPRTGANLPPTVQAVINARLAQLSPAARELVNVAATIGREFNFGVLARASDAGEDMLVRSLDELWHRRIVREQGMDAYDFSHDKIRDVAYAALSQARRRLLHARVAEAFEAMGPSGGHSGLDDLAHHFYRAGLWEKALVYLMRAGEKAQRLFAHQQALSHYTRACECAEALNQPEQLAAVYVAMGDVYHARGESYPAVESYERALALTSAGEERATLKVRIGKSYGLVGDRRGVEFVRAALSELNTDTQANELAMAWATLGRYSTYGGQYSQAIDFLERARHLAEPLGNSEALLTCYHFLAGTLQQLARYHQSIEWARQCVALGERANYPLAVVYGYMYLAEDSYLLGKWQDTLTYAARQRQMAEEIGSQINMAWSEWCRAVAGYGQGNLLKALDAAHGALAMAETFGDKRLVVLIKSLLSRIECDLGEEEAAQADAEYALERADESGEVLMKCASRHALAVLHLQREEWETAVQIYEQCAEILTGTENRNMQLLIWPTYAEAYWAWGRLDRAAEIIADGLALAEDAQSRHFEGVARRVQGQIFMAQKRWDDAERAFNKAIATLDELGSHLELGLACYWRGVMGYHCGDWEPAHSDLVRARLLFQETGAKPMLCHVHGALGTMYQDRARHAAAITEFGAARKIVEELAAKISRETLQKSFLTRANAWISPLHRPSP